MKTGGNNYLKIIFLFKIVYRRCNWQRLVTIAFVIKSKPVNIRFNIFYNELNSDLDEYKKDDYIFYFFLSRTDIEIIVVRVK